MPLATGVVVGVVTHRVSAADPTHELTHLAIDQRSQDKMVVIGHQLVAVQRNLIELQSLMQDFLEGSKVTFFVKDGGPHVGTVQDVVEAARFVSTWWSRHPKSLEKDTESEKRPDPFTVL